MLGNVQEPNNVHSGGRVGKATFHIPNLPDLKRAPESYVVSVGGGGRVQERFSFPTSDWIITVEPLNDCRRLTQHARNVRDYCISGVGEVARRDAQRFALVDATDVLDALDLTLSFGLARWTYSALLVSLQDEGESQPEMWGPVGVSPHAILSNWFDHHHPEHLVEFFQRVVDLGHGDLHDALKDAIYWYNECHRPPHEIDKGIVLAQACLEMLSWTVIVGERELLDKDDFEDLSAAKKIERLLQELRIPVSLPAQLATLVDFAGSRDYPRTGPECVTFCRNGLIHRTPTKQKNA